VTTDRSGRTSAGILLWRRRDDRLEVLLAHQGGPSWVNKDLGHWTIPKGEVEEGEELVAVARREFAEETGYELPDTPLIELGEIRQKSGKLVLAWAGPGRPGRRDRGQQCLRDGVAAPVGACGDLPRDRPRRMVQAQRGASQAEGNAGSISGSAPDCHRC
jgi:8-oxo-dGTP pyrophosphatase MutT (NUDIX family)